MTRVVAYVPDLMDRSRIAAAGGSRVAFVVSPEALAGAAAGADLAVVDLGRPGVLEQLSAVPVPTIGFASHVDRELMARAKAAGCDRVLARSAFFSQLGELLA
jgi:hypothetical protein